MKSIWWLVGLVLVAMGGVVLLAAFLDLSRPPTTVLGELRPGLWWGALMVAAGATFLLLERRSSRS
jgi:hypothetical protein